MTTLYHPTLDAQVEVDDANVSDWTDAGWRKTPLPTSAAATAEDKPGDDKKGSN